MAYLAAVKAQSVEYDCVAHRRRSVAFDKFAETLTIALGNNLVQVAAVSLMEMFGNLAHTFCNSTMTPKTTMAAMSALQRRQFYCASVPDVYRWDVKFYGFWLYWWPRNELKQMWCVIMCGRSIRTVKRKMTKWRRRHRTSVVLLWALADLDVLIAGNG